MTAALVLRAAVPVVGLVLAVRSRRIVNGIQVLIAKGRKQKRREALQGNYAPVKEEVWVQDLPVVQGALPADLDGCYLRNGSNPYFEPYASYHWFEGDGMVHATRIKGGKAAYCNRFMRTARLQIEQDAKFPLFSKFGDQEGLRGLFVTLLELLKRRTGILDMRRGSGTANTSLVYHAGRLMALHEGDLPYQVRVMCEGLVETLGRLKVGDWQQPFTAHPKLDSTTGHLHFIGYDLEKAPHLKYGVLDGEGNLIKQFPLPVTYRAMYHDFAITEHYVVIAQMPLVFDPKAMIENNSLPIVFNPELGVKIGLLPFTATSGDEITWYDLPAFYVFHFANAWEDEGGRVHLHGCQSGYVDLGATTFKEEMGSRMTRYIIDPAAGKASMEGISQVVGDFPICHPYLTGRPTRWAYIATTDTKDPAGTIKGIAKIDLMAPEGTKEAAVATIEYPDGMRGGETFFVPRQEKPTDAAGEDDGYLMVYVYSPKEDTSYMHIYDASTMSSTPVAAVKLPQRVPYGFHTTWVTGQQIKQQKLELPQ